MKFEKATWALLALLCCHTLNAQTTLSATFNQTPLSAAIQTLEKAGGLMVSFDPALVEGVRVTVAFKQQKPAEAFDLLLRETSLTADFLGENYVVLRQRGNTPPPREWTTLCGNVGDTDNHETLPFATVTFSPLRMGTQCDANGRFNLKIPRPVGPGDSVTVRYFGYRTTTVAATFFKAQDCPTLELRPANRELMEIVITDRAVDPLGLPTNGNGQTEVRPERSGFVPGLGEPDPFRMIQFLPGVSANGDKAGELLVRGGSSDQNLVLWEGIPIYHTGHLFGVVSALNPYVVNRVNVWKGNFSADQGGRASSVIELKSEPHHVDRPTIAAGVNFLSAYFLLETPIFHKKGGLMVAARGAFADVLGNKAYQKLFGYATQNSRIRDDLATQQSDSALAHAIQIVPISLFNDGNFKMYWQPQERTRFEWSIYSGSDVLQYRVDANVPEWGFTYNGGDTVQVGNLGTSLRLQQQWTPKYRSEWQFARSRLRSEYDYAGSLDTTVYPQSILYQENRLKETVFRFDNSWQLNERQDLRFGLQAVQTDNYFLNRSTNLLDTTASDQWKIELPSNQSAFYGSWRLHDGERWSVETGLRRVTFNYTARPYWEPRFSAHWAVRPGFQLKLNGGVFRQFMRRAYIWNNLGLNNEVWFTSDESIDLPVLKNTQVAGGFSIDRHGWLLDVEVYGKTLEPLTGVNLRLNGEPQSIARLRGSEYASGLEVLFRKRWGLYTHWLSYTYSNAVARFDSLNGGQLFPTDFDQRHTVNWNHSFDWKRWSLTAAWNFHSGRPFTVPTGIETQIQPDGTEQRLVTYGPRNTARLPDYHRLDLSAQYQFHIGKASSTLGLSIFNFYDRRNVQSRTFFVEQSTGDDGEPRYGIGSLERTALGSFWNFYWLVRW